MINSVALFEYRQQRINEQPSALREFTHAVKPWCYVAGLPIVGLLALVLFLSLGGAFALIGPWAIFVATRVVTKRLGLESPYHEGS